MEAAKVSDQEDSMVLIPEFALPGFLPGTSGVKSIPSNRKAATVVTALPSN
jgi:hypothetical protein